jgi:hypothetical protein
VLQQKIELIAPFHFLRDHSESEIVCEGQQVACDRAAPLIGRQRFDERAR